MNWQKETGRWQLRESDKVFLVKLLSAEGRSEAEIYRGLEEDNERDFLLDDPRIVAYFLDSSEPIGVSMGLYFYVLCRKVLVDKGFRDRGIADYLVRVLLEGAKSEGLMHIQSGGRGPIFYATDELMEIAGLTGEVEFFRRVGLADKSLYISGLFEDYVRYRSQRWGAPGVQYYEAIGGAQYALANESPLATKSNLNEVFGVLSGDFREVRGALSELRDKLVSLGDPFMGE